MTTHTEASAQTTASEDIEEPSTSCCPASEQASCCEPSAKASCCGQSASSTEPAKTPSCGCR
jgi:hypothetical protein